MSSGNSNAGALARRLAELEKRARSRYGGERERIIAAYWKCAVSRFYDAEDEVTDEDRRLAELYEPAWQPELWYSLMKLYGSNADAGPGDAKPVEAAPAMKPERQAPYNPGQPRVMDAREAQAEYWRMRDQIEADNRNLGKPKLFGGNSGVI